MVHEESAKWAFSFNGKSKGRQLVAVDTSLFLVSGLFYVGLARWLRGKESSCQCRRCRLDPWVGKIPWRRKWQPTPVYLPGKSHGLEEPGRLQALDIAKSRTQLSDFTFTFLHLPPHPPRAAGHRRFRGIGKGWRADYAALMQCILRASVTQTFSIFIAEGQHWESLF